MTRRGRWAAALVVLAAAAAYDARPGSTEIVAPARLYPDGPAAEVGGDVR